MARATRFCTRTWAMFRSVPGLNVTVQRVAAVARALRGHVEHVLDAVDLLLDRRGDRLGHDLGAGPGVVAVDLDGRRGDRRVLATAAARGRASARPG